MKKKFIQFMVVLCVVAFASSGFCQIRPGAVTITPYAGSYTFEGNMALENKPFYGVKLGYDFTKNIGAELLFNHVPTKFIEKKKNIDTNVYNYRLEGLYHFFPEQKLIPFISLGVGAQDIKYDREVTNKTNFVANYGYGVKYFVTDNFAFRLDIRHNLAFGSLYNNLELGLGLSFLFGGAKPVAAPLVVRQPEPPAPPPPPPPPPAVKKPEPPPPPPPAVKKPEPPPPPPPPTPAPMQEVRKAPEAATEVEKKVIEKGRATLNVQFDTGKAVVKPKYFAEIKKIADVMEKYPELNILIEGHTDNVGGAKYNLSLSQKRAEAIKKVMVDKYKVKASRITAKGFGFSNPVASNATKEGRQKNRRVEASVEYVIKK